MKNDTKWICLLIGPALLGASSLYAQNPNQGQPPAPMVEIFGCNYVGQADMDDLVAVSNRWNQWADRNGVDDYTAALMTPVMHSDQLPYDVFWLGSNPSGAAFGAGLATWLTEGGDMQAEFEEVVDCASHSLFSEVVLREPEGPVPEAPLVGFQNCTLQQGRNINEAIGAGGRWANYVATNGSDVFVAQLYPAAGLGPDETYNFKYVMGHASAEAWGEFLSMMTRNGFQGAGAAFGINSPFFSCDSSRVYALTWVRMPEQS